MLKKLILPSALLLALLAPLTAKADYVCQTEYFPGTNPGVKLLATSGANCTGTTRTFWACDPTSVSTSCGFLRYTVNELLSLQQSLVSAADTQQVILPSTTSCTGGAKGCLYSVAFRN